MGGLVQLDSNMYHYIILSQIGQYWQILCKNKPYSITFNPNLSLQEMENICETIDKFCEISHQEGYERGWEDCMIDDFRK